MSWFDDIFIDIDLAIVDLRLRNLGTSAATLGATLAALSIIIWPGGFLGSLAAAPPTSTSASSPHREHFVVVFVVVVKLALDRFYVQFVRIIDLATGLIVVFGLIAFFINTAASASSSTSPSASPSSWRSVRIRVVVRIAANTFGKRRVVCNQVVVQIDKIRHLVDRLASQIGHFVFGKIIERREIQHIEQIVVIVSDRFAVLTP